MTISIDLDRHHLTASVGDLLGEASTRAIGLTGSGLSRLWIGSELHRRLQSDFEAAEPGYRSEVPVELEGEVVRLLRRGRRRAGRAEREEGEDR